MNQETITAANALIAKIERIQSAIDRQARKSPDNSNLWIYDQELRAGRELTEDDIKYIRRTVRLALEDRLAALEAELEAL